VDMEVYLGCYS